MELEPTLLLVGAVKAAANAGAAEIGKKTGSAVAERTKGLLVRMHMARRGDEAGAQVVDDGLLGRDVEVAALLR
uniref:hypothetical protein n=1 Tax=Catenulispora pinisilvae TaxID=2705253 RepID=UPI001891F452